MIGIFQGRRFGIFRAIEKGIFQSMDSGSKPIVKTHFGNTIVVWVSPDSLATTCTPFSPRKHPSLQIPRLRPPRRLLFYGSVVCTRRKFPPGPVAFAKTYAYADVVALANACGLDRAES